MGCDLKEGEGQPFRYVGRDLLLLGENGTKCIRDQEPLPARSLLISPNFCQ